MIQLAGQQGQAHGIVNEIYYPHVDEPNTQDFEFLITDGETFVTKKSGTLPLLFTYNLLKLRTGSGMLCHEFS